LFFWLVSNPLFSDMQISNNLVAEVARKAKKEFDGMQHVRNIHATTPHFPSRHVFYQLATLFYS
jgi:hypothetical protein